MNDFFGRLKTLLPKSRFAHSVTVLAGGTALGQAVVVLVSPFLTRFYSPDDFGVLAVYTAWIAILSHLVNWRYDVAIPLPPKDEDALSLLQLALTISLGMASLFGVGVWLFGDAFVSWGNVPALKPYLWLLPVGLFFVGLYQALSYWAIRRHSFSILGRTKLSQGLGLVTAQLGLGAINAGPLGLLVADILGRGAGVSVLWRLVYKDKGSLIFKVDWLRIVSLAYRYRKFPLISSLSYVLNTAGLQVPPMLFAALYGPREAGWYALVQRVMGVPSALVGQSVAQVYQGELAKLQREDSTGACILFTYVAKRLFLLAVGPMLVLGFFAPVLFGWVFGQEWLEAGCILRNLTPMFLASFVMAPLSQTLIIMERQELQAIWDGGRFAVVTASIWLAYRLGWDFQRAVAVYGFSMLFNYVLLYLLSFRLLQVKRN